MTWKSLFPEENRYFETDNGILYSGDSLGIMKLMPPESIDLILTDPPYNISKKDKINRRGGKFGYHKDIDYYFGDWDIGKIEWRDYIDLFPEILTKNGVLILFYDKWKINYISTYLQEEYKFQNRHIGVWIKSNPAPMARKTTFQHGVEFFLISTKNKGTGHHFNWELGQHPDYFKCSNTFKHLHPTQKPLQLIEWLVRYWSFNADLVLDPFIGSGTVAVACEKLRRRWIGIEIDPEYCEITKRRILEIMK